MNSPYFIVKRENMHVKFQHKKGDNAKVLLNFINDLYGNKYSLEIEKKFNLIWDYFLDTSAEPPCLAEIMGDLIIADLIENEVIKTKNEIINITNQSCPSEHVQGTSYKTDGKSSNTSGIPGCEEPTTEESDSINSFLSKIEESYSGKNVTFYVHDLCNIWLYEDKNNSFFDFLYNHYTNIYFKSSNHYNKVPLDFKSWLLQPLTIVEL